MIDGVIKYDFRHTFTDELKEELCKDIENVRKRLFALKLIGEYQGIGYGNISKRVEKNSFIITGTQTGHLKSLTSRHYALIEEFDEKRFFLKSRGGTKPSSESLTHATIYNLDEKINAVIHIHSNTIWRYMLNNGYLFTGENVEYGTKEMTKAVNSLYANTAPLSNPLFAMAGHKDGVIIFGKNLQEAESKLLELIGEVLIAR